MNNVDDGFLRHALACTLEDMLITLVDGSYPIEVGRAFGRVECILQLMRVDLPDPGSIKLRAYMESVCQIAESVLGRDPGFWPVSLF